ncbi:S4 domain-containing protein YaaA [Metabacillus sp. KIGAM252]|uniref:S4 domain-containing protein YaaA n=1 Tax=Metabacillus flavus TaxID=2823519 RepID=A0ABS5L920_9BACI|nr:S4 domain-containing protein YaaA [Metabacillus flavus]MBS2967213.1 S4 domain-containing protein YaaA [Metabacillus flavus]
MSEQQHIQIDTEFITLGQFLKLADVIQSGGMVKWFLSEHEVFVNGEPENRRGKKLRHQDTVDVPDAGSFVVISTHE